MTWWGCPMTSHDRPVPDLVPQLSRGKHRNPRKGACFMELASYLAGERWSDRPACTHRLLAHLARLVNDCTSDALALPSSTRMTSGHEIGSGRGKATIRLTQPMA